MMKRIKSLTNFFDFLNPIHITVPKPVIGIVLFEFEVPGTKTSNKI